MMKKRSPILVAAILLAGLLALFAGSADAQSGSVRPRRVFPPPASAAGSADSPDNSGDAATTGDNRPVASNVAPATAPRATADTTHAYALLKQKQYEAAAREARDLIAKYPDDFEPRKIAGFAELSLKQYQAAADDLQRALDLQQSAKVDDPNTTEALGRAYVFTEKYDRALPLLVAATTRKGAPPSSVTYYYRGVAEYHTGKIPDAERSFREAARLDPKDATALLYLGQIAYERKDYDAAINALNRATINDARLASAWQMLTVSYLIRAGSATAQPKADADYLNAVRASEALVRASETPDSLGLLARALIGAKQYPRAATVLERATAGADAKPDSLYLLGVAYSQTKSYPKAIAALERAAAKSADDASIHSLLGYNYEVTKQYSKALAAYERAAQLSPDDASLKESVERVRPFAK